MNFLISPFLGKWMAGMIDRGGHVARWIVGCGVLWGSVVASDEFVGKPVVVVTAGDGQTISRALASLPPAGGCVELGAGLFVIRSPIVIDRDGVELRGAGPSTVLWLADKANCPMLIVGSAATPTSQVVRDVVVRDLVLDGNRLAQDFECYGGDCNERGLALLRNNGLTIRGAERIHIERVVTRWARSGGIVLEKECRDIRIRDLESHDNEFDGLAAYETSASVFTRLTLHHNRCAGVSLDWRFDGNVISESMLADNGSQGIFMRDADGNRLERLTIHANGAQGIFMAETPELTDTATHDNVMVGLTISANGAQGIRINDASCTGNRLISSHVTGNRQGDISLAAPDVLWVSALAEAYLAVSP